MFKTQLDEGQKNEGEKSTSVQFQRAFIHTSSDVLKTMGKHKKKKKNEKKKMGVSEL